MAIAIFFVLLTGLSALYLLNSVQRAEDSALQEQQLLFSATLVIEEAHTQFKIQIQEWKNLLLRGKNRQAYETYLGAFNRQSNLVQEHLATARIAFDSNSQPQIDELIIHHKKLAETYLKTLNNAKLDTLNNIEILDKSIQGIDRPFDNLFPELIKNLSRSFQNKTLQDNQKHAEASQHYILWISFCVIISTLFIIASFWTAIKTTRKDKFNH
jgi:methyl-accepting chemotaxis protein